jgi:hypothetical protein
VGQLKVSETARRRSAAGGHREAWPPRSGGELPSTAIPVRAEWPDGIVELLEVESQDRAGAAPAVAVSLDRMRAAYGARRWAGSADAVRRLVDREQLPLPAGLIFHCGRCGSTLLANMLAVHPQFRVLNEPDVVNRLLVRGPSAAGAAARDLRMLTRAFGRGLRHGGRVVVKASSWNVLEAPGILAALPGVPAVFLWRRAPDVVASCLYSAPAWAEHRETRQWLAGRLAPGPGAGDLPMKPAELYARTWRAMTRAGHDLPRRAGDRVRLVGYEDLLASPVQVATQIATWFGVRVTDELAEGMRLTARAYSKDPSGRAMFDPDGVHSRPALPDRERALVAKLTTGCP